MRRGGFANRLAIWTLVVLVVTVVVLTVTRSAWLDNPTTAIERRVDILAQLAVGLGTLLLAVVTWGSVYETQRVLADEEKRFRRGRMPAVKIATIVANTTVPESMIEYTDTATLVVTFRNEGDGPARDVSISIQGVVRTTWSSVGEPYPDHHDSEDETGFKYEDIHVASYLQRQSEVSKAFRLDSEKIPAENAHAPVKVLTAEIYYKDVFGEQFHSRYVIAGKIPFDAERYEWDAPPELLS